MGDFLFESSSPRYLVETPWGGRVLLRLALGRRWGERGTGASKRDSCEGAGCGALGVPTLTEKCRCGTFPDRSQRCGRNGKLPLDAAAYWRHIPRAEVSAVQKTFLHRRPFAHPERDPCRAQPSPVIVRRQHPATAMPVIRPV